MFICGIGSQNTCVFFRASVPLSDTCHMEERVKRSRRLSRDAHCDLLYVLSDSIPLEDEIACRFINFIFGCIHFNSTYISSVVRSVFTNMNSLIGKSVRLCALKYEIGEVDDGCWSFVRIFCSALHL